MDPSSLIFVVIVAIWAAYLLGHWVRRRDQVATARSVDRFSEAMRVLERRPAVRAVPLSRPNPRSYVVAPAGRTTSQMTVKRAPAVARGGARRPEPGRPASRPPASRPAAAPRLPRQPGRARGLLLLALLVGTPVCWVLTAMSGLVPWSASAAVSGCLVAMLVHLRRAARRRRELARRRARDNQRGASQARRQSRRAVVDGVVAAHRSRVATADDATAPDVDPGLTESVEDSDGWQPVPVPPPTYTLKAKAPRPQRAAPPPAEPPVPASTERETATEPAAPAEPAAGRADFDLDEILERRIASGS